MNRKCIEGKDSRCATVVARYFNPHTSHGERIILGWKSFPGDNALIHQPRMERNFGGGSFLNAYGHFNPPTSQEVGYRSWRHSTFQFPAPQRGMRHSRRIRRCRTNFNPPILHREGRSFRAFHYLLNNSNLFTLCGVGRLPVRRWATS